MSWSEWQPIDASCEHRAAAVYEVRMTSEATGPVSIPRFLGTDDRGLINIGETGSIETRRKKFLSASEKGSQPHSAGILFYDLCHYSPLNERFPNHCLEFRYRPEPDKAAAKSAEAQLIKEYIGEFGEAPPLNSAIPRQARPSGAQGCPLTNCCS